MSTEVADRLAKMRRPFTAKQLSSRPEIWCTACSRGSCNVHSEGICAICGEHTREAHTHVDYISIAHIKKRLSDTDPQWEAKPLGEPVRSGDWWTIGVELTVCGVTKYGLGQTLTHDYRYGPAGLMSSAISNAFTMFGAGLQTRLAPAGLEGKVLQPLVGATATSYDEPDPGESPMAEANTLAMCFSSKTIKAWAANNYPDEKLGMNKAAMLVQLASAAGISVVELFARMSGDLDG